MTWLRDQLAARGKSARLAFDDKLAGDVLVLSLDDEVQDHLVELTVTHRRRGHAHLTALATTLAGATSARNAVASLHVEISRMSNAKRKFVHRIERLLAQVVTTWDQRQAGGAPARDAALEELSATFPEAVAMNGVGFHVELAGVEDHHTREAYPAVYGAAVLMERRWRGLAWDPHRQRWLMRAVTANALHRTHPDLDFAQSKLALIDAAAIGGVAVATAAMVTAMAGAEEPQARASKASSWCDLGSAFDPCELLSCLPDLADLGDCVPDCDSFDLGALDCGGLDCSL